MSLEPGQSLGPYKVATLIGEGGMGQVWQGTDTQLNRQVALKILPDAFAADPDRLARFKREAQILASLNHPNIAAIYGIEESEGTRALVLELVEGPTLADRISKGPIPLDEALPIAKQIAEALEAAHEAGVIHRDLKPANIKVRQDGTVKVLDFGLAKALDPSPTGDPSVSPTLTAAATQMGVIMGTAAYMSPEQARGKTVDRRADIWAFGAVLYEMLSGRRAFVGADVSDTMAAVLRAEADWDALPPQIPARLNRLARRCLEKDPRMRVRDIGDVRLAMEGAFDTPVILAPSEPSARGSAGWRQALPLALGMLVLGGLVSGLTVWSVARRPDTPSEVVRLTVDGTEVGPARGSGLAISPDGRQIVYIGVDRQLYLRPLDQLTATPLRGARGSDPFFSPDGAWVGFDSERGRLEKVSIVGGVSEVLAELPSSIRGASWGADGQIVAGTAAGGLFRVPEGGGEPTPLTMLDAGQGETSHSWPSLILNHQAVLFATTSTRPFLTSSQLAVLAVETGEVKRLGLVGTSPRYIATGHLVYVTDDGSVLAAPFDPEQLAVTGSPVTLVEGVTLTVSGATNVSLSDTGRLVYTTGRSGLGSVSLVWVDRAGQTIEMLIEHDGPILARPRLSPDGRRVAFNMDEEVWIRDLERGFDTPLTEAGGGFPTWTFDGSSIAFNSRRAGTQDLYSRASDGSGPATLLLEAPETQIPYSWSPDGRSLLYQSRHPETRADIWMLKNGTPEPFLATEFSEHSARISPNGEWVAYVSNRSGEYRIYVQRFPEGGTQIDVSAGAGREAVWSRDGRQLFYRNEDRMMAVAVDPGPEWTVRGTSLLFEGTYVQDILNEGRPNYDVSSDGQRFLMIRQDEAPAVGKITLVLNWFKELERLAPTN